MHLSPPPQSLPPPRLPPRSRRNRGRMQAAPPRATKARRCCSGTVSTERSMREPCLRFAPTLRCGCGKPAAAGTQCRGRGRERSQSLSLRLVCEELRGRRRCSGDPHAHLLCCGAWLGRGRSRVERRCGLRSAVSTSMRSKASAGDAQEKPLTEARMQGLVGGKCAALLAYRGHHGVGHGPAVDRALNTVSCDSRAGCMRIREGKGGGPWRTACTSTLHGCSLLRGQLGDLSC